MSLFLQCLRTLHKHPSGYLPRDVSGVDESKQQRQPPQSHTAVASAGSTLHALHIGEQVGKSLPRHRGVSQLVWGLVRPPPIFVQPVN